MDAEFPVNEYFADSVIDGVTVKKTARTWVAVLLITDPKAEAPFVRVYEWKLNRHGEWKRRGAVTLAKSSEVRLLLTAMEAFAHGVAEGEATKLSAKIRKYGSKREPRAK